jgi:hypothetical protein
MFTDRTEINQRPSFANKLLALQPKIERAKEEMKKRGGLRVVKQLREGNEA